MRKEQDNYNKLKRFTAEQGFSLFGVADITKARNKFNLAEKHYGVDIAASKESIVKSVLEGTVIFADWTTETGHTIAIQHSGNLISVYKHNSTLLKQVGSLLKAGEPIAVSGDSGELSSGPHLHFELWHNGTPVDPEEYVTF